MRQINGVMAFTIAMLMAAFLGLLCHLLVFRPLRTRRPWARWSARSASCSTSSRSRS